MKNFIDNMICRLKEDIKYAENYIKVLEENKFVEERKGGWIPCSERLPEEDVEVLVYIKDCEGNYYYDLTYFHIVWQTEIGGMYSSVIAWQPLPEPYKPKGE